MNLLKILALALTIFISGNSICQKTKKIIIVNKLDSTFTHLFVGDKKHDNIVIPYNYNLGQFIINEISRVIDTLNKKMHTNLEILTMKIPSKYDSHIEYFNIMGKPDKKLRTWLEISRNKYNAYYVLILDTKYLKSEDRDETLNGLDYGMLTYNHTDKLVTYFTLIRYLLFKTDPKEKIEFNYETSYQKDAPYYDFIFNKSLSYEDRQTLPAFHLEYAIENVKEMALIKIEKILVAIVQDINKS